MLWTKLAAVGLFLAATASTGYLFLSDYHARATAIQQNLGERLSNRPLVAGRWELLDDQKLSQRVLDVLRCERYVSRTYQDRQTGRQVSLLVVVGDPSTLAVHPPTVCYAGLGYTQVKGVHGMDMDHGAACTVAGLADPTGAVPDLLVLWSRRTPDGWERREGLQARLDTLADDYAVKVQAATLAAGHDAEATLAQFWEDVATVVDAVVAES